MRRFGFSYGLAGVFCAGVLGFGTPVVGQQILPPDFFARIPVAEGEEMAVAARTMVFDANAETVTAVGQVGIGFSGYAITADRAVYTQRTGQVVLSGNVAILDPDGNEYVADRVELEDGFREGFLQSLTVALPDGTFLSAAQTWLSEDDQQVFIDGLYAPCGTCIDAAGNRIGWTVSAARIVSDQTDRVIYFEEPALQLLGVTVLALPWLSLATDGDLALPVLSYNEARGIGVALPFFNLPVAGGTLAATPAFYTRQGPGLTLDWTQEVGDLSYSVSASGVYQRNPDAYEGLAARRTRGAIQSSGTFTPTEAWTLGWSYAAFTDPAYLPDYGIADDPLHNEAYATYFDGDIHADIRVQQLVPLDNQPDRQAFADALARQALVHPDARFDRVVELGGDAGRVALTGRLLALSREARHLGGHVPALGGDAITGYEGRSVHAMAQALWSNRHIAPGGVAVSPHLGMRLDAAGHDGEQRLIDSPEARTLVSATPIAALDIRYPLLARSRVGTHVIEPAAQIVYRGGPALPGIVNNSSQSVAFDESALFSLDRFSGFDRQETGLRANLGVTSHSRLVSGAWINMVIGQSFHLLGENGFALRDETPAGIGSGLEADASFVVAGLEAGIGGLTGGARVRLDPYDGGLERTGLSALAQFSGGLAIGADYLFVLADTDLGRDRDRHEIAVRANVPLGGYWSAQAGVAWDLSAAQWLEAEAGLRYDDGYLGFGIAGRATGATHRDPDDLRVRVDLSLSTSGRREIVGLDQSFSQF